MLRSGQMLPVRRLARRGLHLLCQYDRAHLGEQHFSQLLKLFGRRVMASAGHQIELFAWRFDLFEIGTRKFGPYRQIHCAVNNEDRNLEIVRSTRISGPDKVFPQK